MSVTTFFITLGLIFYSMTCFAVIDISKKNFGSIEKKAMWGFIALVPFLGCIIYFIFGFRKGIVKDKP